MYLYQFHEGVEFLYGGSRWRCTDQGSRTIAAINLSEHPDGFSGPPYVAEVLFDEDNMAGCEAIPATVRVKFSGDFEFLCSDERDALKCLEDYFHAMYIEHEEPHMVLAGTWEISRLAQG